LSDTELPAERRISGIELWPGTTSTRDGRRKLGHGRMRMRMVRMVHPVRHVGAVKVGSRREVEPCKVVSRRKGRGGGLRLRLRLRLRALLSKWRWLLVGGRRLGSLGLLLGDHGIKIGVLEGRLIRRVGVWTSILKSLKRRGCRRVMRGHLRTRSHAWKWCRALELIRRRYHRT
jgi:hypothetical protein